MTKTSEHFSSSPENEVCRCIRTRVGQENAHKPPSSWETTAALLQMFVTNKAMNIFMDTRGHDRLPLIYRPFTIEEEVTFSEEEDVSAEKGRKEDARCRVCACTEPAAEPVVVIDCYYYIKCTYIRSDGDLGRVWPAEASDSASHLV